MPTAPKRFGFGPAREPNDKPWRTNSASKRKFTGRALQRERERLFAGEPLCRRCKGLGKIAIATIRDHIKALAFGGEDVEGNVQPLCKACSDEKTKGESRDGRRRYGA